MNKTFENKIKVSVIVPIYNVGQYLDVCLKSIRQQTLRDIEIICIDDCSSDNSFEILEKHAKEDNRFIVLRNHRNLGAASTRNVGIQLAGGEYVSILDGDDYFEVDMLNEMYDACKNQDADLGVCNVIWRDETHGYEYKFGEPSKDELEKLIPSFSIHDMPERIFTLFLEVPFNKMYRRDFLIRENLAFQTLPNSNDIYFCQMSMALAHKIVHINRDFIHYRYNRPGQISSNRDRYPYCGYLAFHKMQEHLKRYGLFEICKKSFFDCVAGGAAKSVSCVSKDRKTEVEDFWRNEGFKNLGMEGCKEEDFTSHKIYTLYSDLNRCDRKCFLFTIVIAVYNTEPYIEECLESVVNQDIGFEDNVQVILVDDGSSDGSLELCKKYASKYPNNIRVIHQENKGVSVARNKGIEFATGRYLNFLDSDDKMSTTALKNVAKFFSTHDDVELVSIPILQFGRYGGYIYNRKFKKGTRVIDLMVEDNYVQAFVSSSFIKREALSNLKFDSRLITSEDGKLCTQVLLRKKKIGVVSTEIYYYRRREDKSSTLDNWNKKINLFVPWLKFFVYDLIMYCLEYNDGMIPAFVQQIMLTDMMGVYRMTDKIKKDNPAYKEKLKYVDLFNGALKYIDSKTIKDSFPLSEEEKCTLLRCKAFGSSIKDDVEKKNFNWDFYVECIMPFHLFNHGEKVVLFGNQNVNRILFDQNLKYKVIDIVFSIDDNKCDDGIIDDEIYRTEYDSILITYPEEEMARKAKLRLIEKGICSNNIKWDGWMFNMVDYWKKSFDIVSKIDGV